MPCKGPGPRQRRATKIANRSHVTPFDKLAQWNAQIMRLGTQGAVPSIVGNNLEFVKLTADDIPGVSNNPAIKDLDMNGFGIIRANRLEVDSSVSPYISITGINEAKLTVKSTNTALIEMEGPVSTVLRGKSKLKLETDNNGNSNNIEISPYGTLALQSLGVNGGGNGTIVIGDSSLALMDLTGTQICLDAGTTGLQMGSDGGVTMDAATNIEIDAEGILDLSGNQICIDASSMTNGVGVNISAADTITMDAAKVDVEATTKLDLSGTQMTINSSNNLEVKAGATLDLISSANLNATVGGSNLSMTDLATVLSTKTTTFNATGVITIDAPADATGGIRLKVGSSSSSQLAMNSVNMQIISPEINIGTSTSKVDISGETTIHDLTAEDISCNRLFTGVFIDLSNNKTNTGRFTLQDTNTGPASNKVINAKSGANQVLFGGYDYTDVSNVIHNPTIGGKHAVDRVRIDLEAGANRFNSLVADSGSVVRTLGGIKILPLQVKQSSNFAFPSWGSSLFLGEWGWGNQSWNNQNTVRLTQRTIGPNQPGSGNIYCNTIRQNVVYTDLDAQGPTFLAGYQGYANASMYYNAGDIRYIFVDPKNGSNHFATLILPEIFTPMLGQAITVVRVNTSTNFTNGKTAVLVKPYSGQYISCPDSIFVNDNNNGGIALDPWNDISGGLSQPPNPSPLPNPYKGTEISSVTLVASQNGYYNNAPSNGNTPGSVITSNQYVWQFISSGGPGN